MTDTYTQEIKTYSKSNHIYFCVRYFESKDILNFCRHLFMAIMDRSNRVSFGQTPVVVVIHELTGWNKTVIKRNIAKLVSLGEIEKIGHNQIVFNDLIANRVRMVKSHNGYKGAQPQYSKGGHSLAEKLSKMIKTEQREESEMTKILKQLDNQTKQFEEERKAAAERYEKLTAQIQFIMDKFVPEKEKEQVAEIFQIDDFRKKVSK